MARFTVLCVLAALCFACANGQNRIGSTGNFEGTTSDSYAGTTHSSGGEHEGGSFEGNGGQHTGGHHEGGHAGTNHNAGGHYSGGGHGDPIMTGFDGELFEFEGEVGGIYNILSESEHQVSMKLKLGEMWNKNGTYMEGIGFRYRDHQIIVELNVLDEIEVFLDGKQLRMAADENEQEHILALASGELMLLWQMHRPDVGEAVEITSDMLSVTVFLTPDGSVDEGGVPQPAYLNFNAQLLGPPAAGMKGIIGEGYERMLAKSASKSSAVGFAGNEEEYRMARYFDTNHLHNSFGVAGAGAVRPKRFLMERAGAAFPISFGVQGATRMPLRAAQQQPQSNRLMRKLRFS